MFFVLFFTILFITVIHYVRNKLAPKEIGNIPYVSGWPMMWAMIRQRPHDEVEEVMSKASGEHEIYSTQFGGYKQVNVVGPDCIKDLLTASEDVVPKLEYQPGTAFHKFFGQGLPFSNGLLWKTYRKIATPAFNSSLYPGFAGDGTFELFDFLQERLNQKVDIFQTLQRVTIEILGKMAFGYQFGCLKSDETPHLIQIYQYIIAYVESPVRIMLPFINNLPLESNRKFDEALKEFDKFMFDVVEKKRMELKKHQENPSTEELRDDLLTKILEMSEKEGVYASTKQLRDELVNFFVAGHDTTAMALSISLYNLAKYPEMQKRARAEAISILGEKPVVATPEQLKEMKYLLAVIKESLRILPPTPIVNLRKPTKPIKVGNYVIPKDVLCLVNIWQAHHDPKYWENPHQYNPDRFLSNEKRHQYSWVPFSAGPRNCIGQNFSLMEQRVILSMILQKYELTLPKDTINKEKILLEPNFLLRPIKLELVFNERK